MDKAVALAMKPALLGMRGQSNHVMNRQTMAPPFSYLYLNLCWEVGEASNVR